MTPSVVIGLLAARLVDAWLGGIAVAAEIPLSERQSGYELMGGDTRAMQDDDTANPAMLWVLDGEALWNRKQGAAGKSCADCHGDAYAGMKGVAARYPAFDGARARPVDLEQRINICRAEQQKATLLPFESKDDERLTPFLRAGKELFKLRQGQLNLSCATCHDDNWGGKLAGAPIPQGHPNGYPLYRLEWQTLGSLQRRLRNCLIGMRAEAFAYGAPENVDLELYLMWRARGMKVETPAVRP